ncbi:MAG: carbohydrate binding family 9 domain-containing protein [Proteobacteria bacterium]|nr:carbohydrate binding family 9 domain-containing protein [Pseudomonadota bacterium]
MRDARLRCLMLMGFVACACPAVASVSITNLPHTSGSIKIDGVLDDAAWRHAVLIDLAIETQPGENIPARVQTTAFLIEDGENLYIGFKAQDPDPSAIRAYLRDRDSAYDDDYVGFIVDTYNDGRRAFQFFANPLGVQMDLTNDDVNKNEDDSWDAIWDSAGQINDEGYVVEMRIPLNQLRFPATSGLQSWGIDLIRMYPRGQRYRLSNNPQDRNINCYLCQLSTLTGLKNAEPARDFEIVPTLTASQSDTTEDPGVDPMVSGDATAEAGVSIRWGITPGLTANLTINPDFSQVEADVAQLDVNNRFALFYPEARPFFLEGADYFKTPLQAVFTRTVADPAVGAKLTGKRGNNTFGVFAARDEATNLLFPGPFGSDSTSLDEAYTALVGRYSRGFGNASSFGGLVTVRDGDSYHNYVGGVDGTWRINDQHEVQAQYLKSKTEYPDDIAVEFDQPLGEFEGSSMTAEYNYDSRNWRGNLQYYKSSTNFRADSGFEPQVGGNSREVSLARIWHGESDNWWNRLDLRAEYEVVNLESGALIEQSSSLRFGVSGPMQSYMQIRFRTGEEMADGVLFDISNISVYAQFQPRGGVSLGSFVKYGDQIDFANTRLGDQLFVEPFLNWNINRHLLMRVQGAIVSLDTKQGEKIFDASVFDARLTWQFNLRSFVRLTLQRSDISRNPDVYIDTVDEQSKNMGRQLLYSYKINPQTVFFLGYSDQYVDDDDLDGLTVSGRSWFMKIGYAWNL